MYISNDNFRRATERVIKSKGFVMSKFATAGNNISACGDNDFIVYDDVAKRSRNFKTAKSAATYWDILNHRYMKF